MALPRTYPPPMRLLPYHIAIGALRFASPLLAVGDSKLARGMAGRRHAHRLLAEWGRTIRDPQRPVAWFHAPSVGEGLQAQAVIDALVREDPALQIVFTFFSPSAEAFARRLGADIATYLPWDARGPSAAVLDAMQPDVLVFTKTEVWPVLAAEARRRGIPTAIVGATVPEAAGRMRWLARVVLRPTWAGLRLAAANASADAQRLEVLGVDSVAIETTGDPGIDSAATRAGLTDRDAPWLKPFLDDPCLTVVAGSTWPADEAVLIPALAAVREQLPRLRVVIAPHEPNDAHVKGLLEALRARGYNPGTLGEVEAAGSVGERDAVVVDRVGVLAQLYSIAWVSFVGGGFHDAGLHSVLEPAAAATPVLFGPQHRNARAAGDLIGIDGAKIASTPSGIFDKW